MFITTAGGGMIAATVLGGLLGGGGNETSGTTQARIDPRLDDAIYGAGGSIPAAQDWYTQNKSGMNGAMLTGLNNQYAQLNASPQGYNQMQNLGMGMMGAGVSGNPFANGYTGGTNFSGSTGGNGGSVSPSRQQYAPAAFSAPAGSAFGGPEELLKMSNGGGGWGGQNANFGVPAARPAPPPPPFDAEAYSRRMMEEQRNNNQAGD
jgi:hypothetical protein